MKLPVADVSQGVASATDSDLMHRRKSRSGGNGFRRQTESSIFSQFGEGGTKRFDSDASND
jgi:hypothetical protein